MGKVELKDIRTILIDCDGVLWEGDQKIPGMNEFFDVMEKRGINWALLSNNPYRTDDIYISQMQKFGEDVRHDQILTSPKAVAQVLLKDFPPGTPIYVIGEAGTKVPLKEAGFVLYDGPTPPPVEVPALVASFDRNTNYEMLTTAMRLILGGAKFYGTNGDLTYPTPAGLSPAAGWVVRLLEMLTNVKPIIGGKPEPGMYEAGILLLDADPATTIILGDTMDTDIRGGVEYGIGSIFVRTGNGKKEDLDSYDYAPDYVFESVKELAEALDALD